MSDAKQPTVLDVPVKVVNINIEQAGPKHAADSIVHKMPGFFRGWLDKRLHRPIIEACSEPIKTSTTFGELLQTITRAKERLGGLDTFAKTNFEIEHVTDENSQDGAPLLCNVNISLVENKKLTIQLGADAEVDGNLETVRSFHFFPQPSISDKLYF